MNVDNNDPHQLKTTRTFLYIQKEYKKARDFAKSKTICVTFLLTKNPPTLRYAIFHDFVYICIYINTKSMPLCVM